MGEWQVTNPDDRLARHLAGPIAEGYIKEKLREELRKRVAAHPDSDSAVVVREIAAYLEDRPALRTVAVFAALPGEVDLRDLPGLVERVWVFPRVVGKNLVFHRVRDFKRDLKKGAYGILEPKSRLGKVEIAEVDAFLCPGLGFDLRGGRIGRGKGYYDRMLGSARPEAMKLGVCFGYQLVHEVVMEEHDVRMNGVIAG